jgi:hypothetical protein
MMVGGHMYGQGINNFGLEDIEHSQYVTKAKPSEGLRFVYLPVDGPDYDFAPVGYGNSHNGGAHPTGNEQMFKIDFTDATNPFYMMTGAKGDATNIYTTGANDKTLLFSNNTNFVAIYWKGLPPSRDWLRIDMTRRFNGVPKQANRDIMEVTRPKKNYDARKSFDVLKQLCTNSPVGGHTLKELDASQDALLAAIPEIGGGLGSLQGVDSLQDLAASLRLSTAEQKGLIGETPGAGLNRLYPTLF